MKLLRTCLCCIFALSLFAVPANEVYAKNGMDGKNVPVNVIVKGKLLEGRSGEDSFAAGFIKDDRTYIPLRAVSENLGYTVQYSAKDKKIDVMNTEHHISMNIGSTILQSDKSKTTMDVAPILIDSKTYLPARYLVEAMNETVQWDGKNRVVLLSSLSAPSTAKGTVKEFNVEGHRFTLCLPENYQDQIIVEQKKAGGSIEFYDRYNREHSDENASGHLYTLLASNRPSVIDAPGQVLSYESGKYLNSAFEGGVEYNQKDKMSKDHYDKSKKMVEDIFSTYKVVK